MSRFVLDASVAGAWLLEDEDDPVADAAMSRLATEPALVPQIWHLEVRNTLVVAERRGRVGAAGIEDGLRRVGELPLRTDTEPDLGTALALARRRRLAIYDQRSISNWPCGPTRRSPRSTRGWRARLSPRGFD